MLHIWDAERDLLCSGTAEEDLARYERWLTENAIWSAMTGRADSVAPVTGFGENAGVSTAGETPRRPPPPWKLGQRASDDRGCT